MTATKYVVVAVVGWVTAGAAVAALFGWWLHHDDTATGGDEPATCDACGYWFTVDELDRGVCPECTGLPVDDPRWDVLVARLLGDLDDLDAEAGVA